MNMKPIVLFIGASLSAYSAMAEELANPDAIQAIKEFAPPKPITPNVAQGYFPENQFDGADRSSYHFVTQQIDQALSPLKINSGIYGDALYHSVSSQFRDANWYVMANVNDTKAKDYRDGAGKKVDWQYHRFNQAAVLGLVPSASQEYRLTVLHDDINHDRQPHFNNDALNTDRLITRLNARWGAADLSNTVQAEAAMIRLKRHADNYTYRSQTPNDRKMYIDLNRKISQLSVKHDVDIGAWHNTAQLSYQHDEHNAIRNMHTPKRDFASGYRFADIHADSWKISDTLSYRFDDKHQLALGLTYQNHRAKVEKNTTRLANPNNPALFFASPQDLWQTYFAYPFSGKVRADGISAELKYDFTPNEQQKYSLSLASIERIGNNVERFNSLAALLYHSGNKKLMYAPNNPNAASSAIVGNPLLKNERHNYVKFTFDVKNEHYQAYHNSLLGAGWHIGGSVMYDRVQDLIIFDRARGQNGVATNTGAVITRNVDADIVVANAFARYNFNPRWAMSGKLFYNYGHNQTDNRPLYQIRPLEFTGQLDYQNYFSHGSYNLGVAGRWVAAQHRGDFDTKTGLGIDKREAAKSFFTVDAYGSVNIQDRYGIRFGVNNVFNKQYAEYISGNHVLALSPSVVYAPARTYWLSLHAAF